MARQRCVVVDGLARQGGVLFTDRMGIRFGVLGALRVEVDGGQVPVRRPARRRLLALLLLESGRRQSTDVLIERFWAGDPPASPKAALQTHLSALRALLPDGAINTEGYGYRLPLDDHQLDARQFTAFVSAARQALRRRDWPGAEQAAEAAAVLWRGAPFPELLDDHFAQPERTRLAELRYEVEEIQAQALLEQGRADEALLRLELMVPDQPLRERRWEQLMLARHRLGRRAAALAAYRQAREALAEVGLEPGRDLERLQVRVLRQDPSLSDLPPHNLPVELNAFVGRDHERAAVADLALEHRLVTLTGVGGAGKTRLALRVARDLLGHLPDGARLVELATVIDPDDVGPAVAGALGTRAVGDDMHAALRSALVDRTLLVVLDNCEHQVVAAALAARSVLEAAPGVRVLATSREPLVVPGEVVYEVPPMAFPTDVVGDADGLRGYDAIRLFENRAAAARPGYRIDDEAAVVAELCRRLDGVPLAIELAAARMRSLTAATILDRLDQRFRMLTSRAPTAPPRQRTLEATVRWSFDLLSPVQRTVFVRLGVFHGDIELRAAEQVVADDGIETGTVVPVLSDLVDRSLVTTSTLAPDRYRLLETLRAFAVAELDERPDAAAARRRHRDWFVTLADGTPDGEFAPGRRESVHRLAASSEDLTAALAFSLAEGPSRAVVPLARALAIHWTDQGHFQRAVEHLELALEHGDDVAAEAELRSMLAAARFAAGDVDQAFEDARTAAGLARRIPPSPTTVRALARYARLHPLLVDRDASDGVPIARDALEIAEAIDEPYATVVARVTLAQVLGWSGSVDDGLAHQRLALDVAEGLGDAELGLHVRRGFFDLLYLHPTHRRSEPRRVADRILAMLDAEESPERFLAPIDWVPYALLQDGAWSEAESVLDRLERRHLEGYQRTWQLMVRATLRWMQGRTAEARTHLDVLERMGINPRWYHDYFPLRAEIAADDGRLEEVRALADRYLAVEVDEGEMPHKPAVLGPVVRAEVDAARRADRAGRPADGAHRAFEEMQRLAAAHPHPTGGSLQLETVATHLAFAEAELSRLTGREPVAAWRRAHEQADFEYYRLYAGWRLAEAATAVHHPDAADLLARARSRANDVGAERLAGELDRLARRQASRS